MNPYIQYTLPCRSRFNLKHFKAASQNHLWIFCGHLRTMYQSDPGLIVRLSDLKNYCNTEGYKSEKLFTNYKLYQKPSAHSKRLFKLQQPPQYYHEKRHYALKWLRLRVCIKWYMTIKSKLILRGQRLHLFF